MRLCQFIILTLLVWEVMSDCINPDTAMFESECRTNPRFIQEHILPPNWGLMLDSRDFRNLVADRDPAWVLRDVDGDGGQWGQSGGNCQFEIKACSYGLPGQQDNWFFTNYITFPTSPLVDGVTEVYFETSVRFSRCTGNPNCTNAFATVYKFDSNSPAQVSEQTDPANYQLLRSTEMDSRLQQVGSTDTPVLWRIPKSRFPAAGFYLGFRDTGTCGPVKRIFVYYMKAPMYSNATTLLTCPNVPLPPQDSSRSGTTRGTCCCGEKATNASSLERVCRADGTCEEPSTDVCGCQPGYEFVNNQCVACTAGTFQSDISRVSRCVSCPANSVALFPAAAVCNCTGATIRNINRPRDPCAESPSPPLLTVEPVVDGTYVDVCWGAALDSGGLNDLHYNIYVHQTGVDGPMYRKVNNVGIMGTGEICHPVSGLNPMSSYAIVVTSANGATGDPETLDQSLTTVDGQYVAFFVDTGEPGLRKGEAIAVTFFITLLVVAIVTGLIVFLIMWFVCVNKKNSSSSPNNGVNNYHYDKNDEVKSYPSETPPSRPSRPSAPPRPLKPKV